MNQIKKSFLYIMLLLHLKATDIFAAAPAPTTYNLPQIQSLIANANSSVQSYTTWGQTAQGPEAVADLIELVQALYQIIDILSPELGAYLETLDPVFSQGTTYVTADELNASAPPAPAPTPVTIPQAVYTSMTSPLGTIEATAYPLTTITTNIVETSTEMTTISTWNSQLNFLTAAQLSSGIYFVMSINTSTNTVSCYVFAPDQKTQIGQTFTVPLTCAPNELSVDYNSQTTTISSTLPATFALLVTSNYAKSIPSSVMTSMNSPQTITVNAPFLQATAQVQQTGQNNSAFDMGPFTGSSLLNTISDANWMSGIYITMFINTTSSSVIYDFWASDKTTHLGNMTQPLQLLTGITGSTFTYQSSNQSTLQTANITPTKALFIKASQTPAALYSSYLATNKAESTSISNTDLESLQIIFNQSGQQPQTYSAYSANGISGQLLQNTEINLSEGVYLVPVMSNSTNCNAIPCLLFFDNNRNFLGIQGLVGSRCPEQGWTGFSLKTANTSETNGIPFGMSFLLKITA